MSTNKRTSILDKESPMQPVSTPIFGATTATNKTKKIQRTYMMEPDIEMALNMEAARRRESNSKIINEALRQYLKLDQE